MTKDRRRSRIVLSGWFVLIAILGYLWATRVEPGYFARNFLAFLYSDFQSPPISTSLRGNVAGMEPFLLALHLTTGIPIADLGYIPVGAFFRSLLYYAIVRSVTGERLAGVALALMTAVYPWAGWGYSNTFVHSLGGPLFLTAVLIAYIGLRDGIRREHSLVLMGVLAGVHLLDYTTEVWTIGLLLALGLWTAIIRRPQSLRSSSSLFTLATLGGVLFYTKQTAVTFVGKVTTLDPTSALSGYFASSSSASYPYKFQPKGDGLGLSTYFHLAILVSLGCYAVVLAYQTVKQRSLELTRGEMALGMMAASGVGTTALYTFMGRFSQFFIFIGFPLLAVCCLWFLSERASVGSEKVQHLPTIAAAALLILAGAEASVLLSGGNFSRGSDSAVEPGGDWLLSHSESPVVLTGLDSRGKIRRAEARSENSINWSVYTPKRYIRLVNGRSLDTEYVALDYRLRDGTLGLNNWQTFDNVRSHRDEIQSNPHLDTVYSSGGFVIQKVDGER